MSKSHLRPSSARPLSPSLLPSHRLPLLSLPHVLVLPICPSPIFCPSPPLFLSAYFLARNCCGNCPRHLRHAIESIIEYQSSTPAYITGGRDGEIKFWHPETFQHQRTIHHSQRQGEFRRLNADRIRTRFHQDKANLEMDETRRHERTLRQFDVALWDMSAHGLVDVESLSGDNATKV